MLGMKKTISRAGHGKDFLHKLLDIQYPLCGLLLSLIIIIIIIIIIIMIIIMIIIIIIIIIIIHPFKFSAIQGLKKIGTCSLGILFVVTISKNRFVRVSVAIGVTNP